MRRLALPQNFSHGARAMVGAPLRRKQGRIVSRARVAAKQLQEASLAASRNQNAARSQFAARRYHFDNFSHARVNNLSDVGHCRSHKDGVFLRASTQSSADHVTAKACVV